ncbi:DUF4238 domain-containing protein [Kitasatospora paranensis]|uniref:DUF4238 domain-containing protein n=1 Tax=Kitasatospora paranensis TaxID=258053 RepID=A0ABW2G404_9ACTN
MDVPEQRGQRAVEAERILAQIEELQPEGQRRVVNQHVVSRVLLKRFAANDRVISFDLHHPANRHRPGSTKTCGTVPDFVPFASASLEEVWSRVENLLPTAADAVERGDIFEHEEHILTLKDFIALHRARSLHYLAMHYRAAAAAYERAWDALAAIPTDRLRATYRQHTGLYVAAKGAREAIGARLMQPFTDNLRSGADLRVSIERMFGELRTAIRETCLEIVTPKSGEFLIGDIPALPVRREGTVLSCVTALEDSAAIVLPFGRKHLLVGRAPSNDMAAIPADMVDCLNTLQVEAAYSRVYLHPGSGLEHFVRAHLAAGGRADRTPLEPPRRDAGTTP